MYLRKIRLKNFRNYNSLLLCFNKGINIIYGENAQGKTNILESIYVLAFTETFRNTIIQDMIKLDNHSFFIEGLIKENKLDTKYNYLLINNKKSMMIDGYNVKKVSDYISNINIIIFTPEDLDLIKGPPSTRRKFLNTELSQLYRNYFILYSEYEKVLNLRNEYIKSNRYDKNYLDIITNYIVEKNILIYKLRLKFINKINEYCSKIYKDITGLNGFTIEYRPNVDYSLQNYNKDFYLKKFQSKYEYEYKIGSTYYGVHKDDFSFNLKGNDLKIFGSQGQKKVAVLTLKLSEIEILKKYKKTTPILLLDDVFSEIDSKKNNNLLKYINSNLQVIITAISLKNVDKYILKHAKIFNVNNGKVKIQRGDFNE